MYKAAEAKEKVCLQATGGKYQFGAAHLSSKGNLVPFAYVPPASAAAATPGPPEGALEGYFDALAAAASTDQNVLAKLVESVAKLTKANAELVQAVETLTKANEVLSSHAPQRNGRTCMKVRKRGQNGKVCIKPRKLRRKCVSKQQVGKINLGRPTYPVRAI